MSKGSRQIPGKRKLTERQRRFVEFYAKTGNATESARLAGYSSPKQQGTENLSKPSVRSAIDAINAKTTKKHIMSIEERKARLTEIAEGEDERTAIKAMDVLNKMGAVYIQKQEITHNFQGKTDGEVIKIAIEQLEALGYTVVPP